MGKKRMEHIGVTMGLGVVSLLFQLGAIIFIGFRAGSFDEIWAQIAQFFTGKAELVEPFMRGIRSGDVGELMLWTAIALVVGLISGPVFGRLAGEAKGEHAVGGLFVFEKKLHVASFFVTIIIEELFARVLFIGVIGGMIFRTTGAMYVCALVGNALWALAHLKNYKDKSDWNIWRVMPQFVAGFVETIVFINYGFLAALLVHVAYDVFLFSVSKKMMPTRHNFGIIIVNIAILVGTLSVGDGLRISLPGIFAWMSSGVPFDGWVMWDYLRLMLVTGAGTEIIQQLFLLDSNYSERQEIDKLPSLSSMAVMTVVMAMISAGMYMFVYWLAGLVPFIAGDVFSRALVAALLPNMFTAYSGSAMARRMWNIPHAMICVLCYQALGFWGAVGVISVRILIATPEAVLCWWKDSDHERRLAAFDYESSFDELRHRLEDTFGR